MSFVECVPVALSVASVCVLCVVCLSVCACLYGTTCAFSHVSSRVWHGIGSGVFSLLFACALFQLKMVSVANCVRQCAFWCESRVCPRGHLCV